jgi:hypothetical protein
MYIISKNKDYYDGVVGTVGMDKTIVYERVIEEITDNAKIPKEFRYKLFSWDDGNPFLNVLHMNIDHDKTKKYEDVDGFIVGFCGKLYIGYQLHYKEMVWDAGLGHHETTKTDIIYGLEEAVKFLKTDYWRGSFEDDLRYIGSYDPIQIFRDFKTPVFVFDGFRRRPRNSSAFIVNANLKEWEFYKVVDAFTAFTELQMFISGVLGTGEKEIIEVADEHKISQHGFDKWSFRREPSKKK